MNSRAAHSLTRLFGVLLLLLSAAAGAAHAQTLKSLKDAMLGKHADDGRSRAAPKVAHYMSEDGESFVFDASQPVPLLRFDGDDEIFALTASAGTKGDVVYKNDVGEPVLKSMRWGGMVLFSDDRPMGDPVAVAGKADPFQPDVMTPALLWQSLARASRRATQALERLIPFDAPEVTPGSDALFADAFEVTSNAIVHVAAQNRGRQSLSGLREVQFVEGRPPSARLEKGVLTLKLDVSRGAWGGHVSSKRIINVLQTSYSIADDRH